jgi:hypothetical protein
MQLMVRGDTNQGGDITWFINGQIKGSWRHEPRPSGKERKSLNHKYLELQDIDLTIL